MRVAVRVPATSANLGPGFDALGLALDLHDHVTLDVSDRAVDPIVEIRGEAAGRLPRTGRNLALRAVQRLLDAAVPRLYVAQVTLDTAIPIGGGLGSSAAAIAGGLVAANAAAGAPYGTDDLLRLALELEPHPDNLAPAFHGGLTVAALDGDRRPLVITLPPPAGLRAVVLTPRHSVSTRESRAALPMVVPHGDAAYTAGRAALLVAALTTGRHDLLGAAMDDRLHQPYRSVAYPAMPAIIAAARDTGAAGAALSGSGPSILALCTGPTAPIAAAMEQAAARAGLSAHARDLAIVADGASIVSIDKEM